MIVDPYFGDCVASGEGLSSGPHSLLRAGIRSLTLSVPGTGTTTATFPADCKWLFNDREIHLAIQDLGNAISGRAQWTIAYVPPSVKPNEPISLHIPAGANNGLSYGLGGMVAARLSSSRDSVVLGVGNRPGQHLTDRPYPAPEVEIFRESGIRRSSDQGLPVIEVNQLVFVAVLQLLSFIQQAGSYQSGLEIRGPWQTKFPHVFSESS